MKADILEIKGKSDENIEVKEYDGSKEYVKMPKIMLRTWN